MQRIGTVAILICASVILLGHLGCGLKRAPMGSSGSTPLIDGLMSRQSPAEAKLSPQLRGLNWTISEDSRLPAGDRRPRFDILTIEAKGYVHQGIPGRLTLHFFNDRLEQTDFAPDDYAGFQHLIELSLGTDPRSVSRGKVIGGTKIWTAKDPAGDHYIGWMDISLAREQSEWIGKYS